VAGVASEAGLPPLPEPPQLPGGVQMLAWCAGSLAVGTVTGVVVLAVSGSAAAGWPLLVAAYVGVILASPVRRAKLRSFLADPQYRTVADDQAFAGADGGAGARRCP
jgi:hypothetical protein